MKCNECGAELEEGVTICPACGKENIPQTEEVPAQQPEQQTEETEQETAVAQPEQTDDVLPEQEAASEQPEQKQKLSGGKIALLVILAVAAIAVVAALIVGGFSGGKDNAETTAPTTQTTPQETTAPTIPEDGNPDDVTCKGTYTAEGEELTKQMDQVVATLEGEELTNGELQVFYWMQFYDFMQTYGQYAPMFGLDMNTPMDMQKSMDQELTWQQFFLREALNSWRNYKALSLKAEEEGFAMDAELTKRLQQLPQDLEATAQKAGFESVEAMIQSDMGPGATFSDYETYMNDYYKGFSFYGHNVDKIQVTDEDVAAFFEEHAQEYNEKGLKKDETKTVDVRHILVKPEGGTTDDSGKTTYSDEEWAACEKKAQEILDEYLAGDQTEERFAELATKYSEDPGSASKGGLYTDVYEGQMVAPFEEWSFDDARKAGDYGLVKTDYGYHVMYYVDSRLVWYTTAKKDLLVEKGNEFLQSVVDDYAYEVDYSAIALGLANLTKE